MGDFTFFLHFAPHFAFIKLLVLLENFLLKPWVVNGLSVKSGTSDFHFDSSMMPDQNWRDWSDGLLDLQESMLEIGIDLEIF